MAWEESGRKKRKKRGGKLLSFSYAGGKKKKSDVPALNKGSARKKPQKVGRTGRKGGGGSLSQREGNEGSLLPLSRIRRGEGKKGP